jgi:hypothetical protein
MTKQDWENAFGSVPMHFENMVARELRNIERTRPVRKIKPLTIAAIACIITLLGAIAYAAVTQWSMESFLGRWYGEQITQEGQKALQTMEPGKYAAETTNMTVTVRQALYDGQNLHVLIAAAPKDPERVMLLGFDTQANDPLANLGLPEYENDLTPINESELAQGKVTQGVECTLYYDGEMISQNMHYAMEADGTQVFLLSCPLAAAPGADQIELQCDAVNGYYDEKAEEMVFQECSFTFPIQVTRLENPAILSPTPEA